MDISQEYVSSTIPQGYPPFDLIPPEVSVVAEKLEDDLIRRSLSWTAAIFSELRYPERWRASDARLVEALFSMLPTEAIAVGLLDPNFELPGFGVALHVPWNSRTPGFRGGIFFPRLQAEFPIVERHVWEEHQSLPNVHPFSGTSTCWATDKGSGTPGLLTAKHCTNGYKIGGAIALSPLGNGIVVKKGAYVIDAAFIEVNKHIFPGTTALSAMSFPTAAVSLVIHLASGPITATVVDVTNTFGVINDHSHPIKVYFDKTATAGDSGTLLTSSSGEGVAIYSGIMHGATFRGMTGLTLGYGQHLEQASVLLNLTLYK